MNIVAVALLCLVLAQLAYSQVATQREKASFGCGEIIWQLRAGYGALNRGDFDAAVFFKECQNMTKSVMPDGKLHNSQWLSPTILIRVGSILMVGLMIGHLSAYPWTSIKALQDTQLTTLMKSVPFEFMGERSTYWNLYFGWGVLVAVLLLALASILWILPVFAMFRPRSAGAISAIVSSASLVGAYLSFRFFYIPPFILFSIICATLTGATTQLLRQRNEGRGIGGDSHA